MVDAFVFAIFFCCCEEKERVSGFAPVYLLGVFSVFPQNKREIARFFSYFIHTILSDSINMKGENGNSGVKWMKSFSRKIRKDLKIVAFFMAVVLTATVILSGSTPEYTLPAELQDLDIQSVIGQNAYSLWSIHYPSTGNAAVDQQIQQMITALNDEFNQAAEKRSYYAASGQLSEINVDYEVSRYNEKIVSFGFHIYEEIAGEPESNRLITYTFNLENGDAYTFNDLFREGYEERAYQALGEGNGITASGDMDVSMRTGLNFMLSSEAIALWLPRDGDSQEESGLLQSSVPIEKIQDCLNLEMLGERKKLEQAFIPGRLPQRDYNAIGPDPGTPKVAITFDDGPTGEMTLRLLEELEKRNVKATFFVLGNKAEHYPEIISAISQGGHEIGNHGYNHKDMRKMKTAELEEQFERTDQIVEAATGKKTTCLRPPYGNTNDRVSAYARSTMRPIVMWSVDTLDWKNTTTKNLAEKTVARVKDGDIILLHDTFSNSVDAAIEIIDQLMEQGYEFMTVSELISYSQQGVQPGEIYYKLK